METIEAQKNAGNAKFSTGDVDGAIQTYRGAVAAIAQLPDTASSRQLHVALLSNLSNAHLSQEDYALSWETARAATDIDPAALKPWLRFVEARAKDGYPFDALVHQLRYVRPCVRAEVAAGRLAAREAADILTRLEQPLYESLGLSRVSPDIELVEYAGGVDMISRRAFAANEVVFIEKKYNTYFNEDSLNLDRNLTTVTMVEHFSRYLQPEQTANTPRWRHLLKEFYGAWPRALDDIDAETQSTVRAALEKVFPTVKGEPLDQLIVTSLMCRYNCFHSGFFRMCALANHSCRANIAMKYNNITETVSMITVSDIQPGERMNVKYLSDAHFLMGLGQRRTYLRSWLFWCTCPRCVADNAPGAAQEHLRCSQCGDFTHSPFQGDGTEVDPMLPPLIERHCTGCGSSLGWAGQCEERVRHLVPRFMESTSQENGRELAAWAGRMFEQLAQLPLHPLHWSYRVLCYFVCVPLTSLVNRGVEPLRQAGAHLPLNDLRDLMSSFRLKEQYLPLLVACGGGTAENADGGALLTDPLVHAEDAGCDALRMIEVLWHLISPFYPAHEMWAIHRAACQLVLMHMLFQSTLLPATTPSRTSAGTPPQCSGQLTTDRSIALLQRHGPYIGSVDSGKWMHMYTLHKGSIADAKTLPPLSRIKKAFRI